MTPDPFYASLPEREDMGIDYEYCGNPLRGLFYGVLFSLPFWAALIAFVVHVVRSHK